MKVKGAVVCVFVGENSAAIAVSKIFSEQESLGLWNHVMKWVNCARIWSPAGMRRARIICSLPGFLLLFRNFA